MKYAFLECQRRHHSVRTPSALLKRMEDLGAQQW